MDEVQEFLFNTQWNAASIDWFDADWSVRRYARLTNDHGKKAILLQSPPDDSPDAMIGHMIGEWSSMNNHFQSINVNVPTIIKQDLNQAFILMNDFGTDTIAGKGLDAYLKATDILIQMRDHKDALSTPLLKYEDTHVYQALRFFPLYTLSSLRRRPESNVNMDCGLRHNDDFLVSEWFKTWSDIETSLPPCPRALTHIDYAPQNLMWDNGEIGVIDFQAACDGPFVYDLVNLLEDIRIDVPIDIKQSCKDHYCATLSPQDKERFDMWYPVITAQFHARILGQIQHLSKTRNNTRFMGFYDWNMKRFEQEIEHELLKQVKEFIRNNK